MNQKIINNVTKIDLEKKKTKYWKIGAIIILLAILMAILLIVLNNTPGKQ